MASPAPSSSSATAQIARATQGAEPWGLESSRALVSLQRLPRVTEVHASVPLSGAAQERVVASRVSIGNILCGSDSRLLVLAGPCSLHDLGSASEFAERLAQLQAEVSGSMLLVMRAMFEKPRSSVGWKGYAHQPQANGPFDMPRAISELRQLFVSCAEKGVPLAAEALDLNLQDFFLDTMSYLTIGARTSESQVHRQFASSVRVPVGIKNPGSGSIKAAVDGVQAAASRQSLVFRDVDGALHQAIAEGNPLAHVVLRGGAGGPNYGMDYVQQARALIAERSTVIGRNLLEAVVVDCSHDNSRGDYLRQAVVFQECIDAISQGDQGTLQPMKGLMLEVNLRAGKQLLGSVSPEPGCSITDACIGFDTLRALVLSADEQLRRKGTNPKLA